MKTPEEIKKGLEQCVETETCENCGYLDDCMKMSENTPLTKDALTYIQHLESRLAQVERERDAAVDDLENSAPCFACYHFMRNKGMCRGGMRCCDEQFRASIGLTEYDGPEWQWRGVCPENTKEGSNIVETEPTSNP